MSYQPKSQHSPPSHWQDFELLCCDLWRSVWKDPNAQRFGRGGQSQYGIDILGQPNQNNGWVGVQCKCRDELVGKRLTEKQLRNAVDEAKKLVPPLSGFILATTAPRDVAIQKVATQLTDKHRAAGLFSVHVYGWEDIDECLIAHRPPLARQKYPDLDDDPLRKEVAELVNKLKRGTLGDLSPQGSETGSTSSEATLANSLARAANEPVETSGAESPRNTPTALRRPTSEISGTGELLQTAPSSDLAASAAPEHQAKVSHATQASVAAEPGVKQEPELKHEAVGETITDALSIVDHIRSELAVWNYEGALQLAETLETCLEKPGLYQDAIAPRLSFLLARVHVNRAETNKKDRNAHIGRAEELLTKARDHSSDSELLEDIEVIQASIENIKNGPEAALKLLEGKNSPYAIRIRLAMLLNLQRLDDAVKEIEGLEFHERWCDLGTTTFAANDRVDTARELAAWSAGLRDKTRYMQCTVRLADAMLVRTLSAYKPGQNIQPHDISPVEKQKLEEILVILEPVLAPIRASSNVDSELAATAVRVAWQVNHLLQRVEVVAEITRLMYTHKPVPLDVGRSVVSGYIQPPDDLPARLRDEHPNDLDAYILATVVQSARMGQHSTAFVAAKEAMSLADAPEKKEELAKLFQQIWQELEGDEAAECEGIVDSLIEEDTQWRVMFEASTLLRQGKVDDAIKKLEACSDKQDVYWLQLYGNALFAKQRTAEAVDYLLEAAKKTRDPILFHKTADLAVQSGKTETAVWCYEQLIALKPDHVLARSNLANLYTFTLHDLEKAAVQFEALYRMDPENPDYGVNLAICLAQSYRNDESLKIYDEICAKETPDIRAILGRAQLLEGMGLVARAFKTLHQVRDSFWSDQNFVLTYWKLASSADHDDLAHEAFMQMDSFRRKGEVDEKLFRMVNLDEIKDMMKKGAKQTQDRTQTIHTEMLKGRMPWLWAEEMAGNASYWGWRNRTQAFDWIYDDPINRANYCIYATNGFHARVSERGIRELLPIECAARDTKVVVDLSALITLHRLGLLDEALAYFGSIVVPTVYLSRVLEESSKLAPHQLSRKSVAEAIENKLRLKNIAVIGSREDAQARKMIHVDEHSPDEKPGEYYHLKDILQPLFDSGRLPKQAFDRASRVAQRPSIVDDDHPAVGLGQEIVFELSTLETLAGCDLLDLTLSCFKVHLLAEAEDEIVARLRALGIQDETREWHLDLWSTLRNDDRVSFVPHKIPEQLKIKDDDQKNDIAFAATFIAQAEKLSLLADDRVCQAFTLNENSDVGCAAFGTDKLLVALAEEQLLNPQRLASCFLQLMAWRYRFLIPPANVLVDLATQYAEHPPGQPLRDIARYIHDCMRDPGLFGGFEATDQPVSMAMRLLMTWISTISDFLMDVWCDSDFADDKLKELTNWSIKELLPSSPRVLGGLQKVRISDMTARYVISQAMIRSIQKEDEERVGDCLAAIRDALGLDEKDYLEIVTGVLDGI